MPRSVSQARAYGSSSGTRATSSAMNSSRCNQNQGGGDKKQGLLSVVGNGQFSLWNGMRRAGSTPETRRKVFCLNQLGGVGSGFYQTRGPSDGVKKTCQGSKNEKQIPRLLKVAAVNNFTADALMEFFYPASPNNQVRVLLQSIYMNSVTNQVKTALGSTATNLANMNAIIATLPSVALRVFVPGSIIIPMLLGKTITNNELRSTLTDNMLVARFSDNDEVELISKNVMIPVSDYMYGAADVPTSTNAPSFFTNFAQQIAGVYATSNASGATAANAILSTINQKANQFDNYNSENKLKEGDRFYVSPANNVNLDSGEKAPIAAPGGELKNPQSFMNRLHTLLDTRQPNDITDDPSFALVIGSLTDLNSYFIEEKWKSVASSLKSYTLKSATDTQPNPVSYVSHSPSIGTLPAPMKISDSNLNVVPSYYQYAPKDTLVALLK